MKGQFEIKVEGKAYTVYPNLQNMIDLENTEEVVQALGPHSIPTARSAALGAYLDKVYTSLKSGKYEDGITKEQLEKVIKESMQNYSQFVSKDMLKHITVQLEKVET